MAVFSNLEGTMKKTFILGKNGAQFSTDGVEVSVRNYQGTQLVPFNAADPVNPSNVVTLSYFNAHSGGGSGGALSGTVEPDVSLGENGDTYFQLDDVNIINIFFKDQNIWKPFKVTPPVTDSDYVTSITVQPSDFVPNGSEYSKTITAAQHGRGANLLIQVQDPGGNTVGTSITVDDIGNITITVVEVPTTYLNVKLIGETTMSTPYSALVNKSQWTNNAGVYTLSVASTVHGQEPGPLYLAIYENAVDGAVAAEPYNLVTVDSTIDSSGNVAFKSFVPFSGKVVISGK